MVATSTNKAIINYKNGPADGDRMRPLRVLFISRYAYPDGPGGGQVSGRLLALAVAQQGHDVRFACMREGIAAPQTEKDEGMAVIRYPYRRWRAFRRFSNTFLTYDNLKHIVRREIRGFKPDVVHFLNFDSFIFGAAMARALRVPSVTTVNGPCFFCVTMDGLHADGSPCIACDRPWRDSKAKWGLVRGAAYYSFGRWMRSHLARTLPLIDRLIAVSGPMRDGLLGIGVPDGKIKVVHNPINDVPDVKPTVIEGITKDDVVFLFTGRVTYDKNVQIAIRALPSLPRVKLVVVGDGDYLAQLRALAESEGVAERVVFTGKRAHKEVAGYVAAADVVIVPSIILDAFSRTAVEALAMGKPCIVSDRGGNPEIIKDGEYGFVVDPFDLTTFTARAGGLVEKPGLRRTMGAAGRRWARRSLSMDATGRKLIAIYRTIVKETPYKRTAGSDSNK